MLDTLSTSQTCAAGLQTTAAFRASKRAPRSTVVYATAELKKPDQLRKPEQLNRPARPQAPPQGEGDVPIASSSKPMRRSSTVTVEFQRKQAKELQKYFKDMKELKEFQNRQVFGWTPQNEILNGRWVMMGIGIGLLTEYATGVDFPNQLKLMLSYLGIADVYD